MRISPATPSPTRPAATTASSPQGKPFSDHVRARLRAASRSSGGSDHASPAPAAGASTLPPAATATAPSATASTPGSAPDPTALQGSVNQSQDQNMQFLELQSQIDTQSEMFTAMSNVEKAQTDTLKNTAQNMAV